LGSADGARLGYGKRRLKVRIDRIGSMLRDHQVDVAVLNEVPLDRSGMHGLDVPHWLAVSGGFAYRAQQRNVDVTFPFYHIRHGNLILSRYPITDARLFDLPTASSLRSMFVGDRDGLLATVRVGSQTIDVLGVQLVAGAEQEGTRAQGAERILERAEESQVPLLVAGDLQTMPASYPDAPQDPDYGNALSLLLQSRHFTSEPGMAGPLEAERLTFPAHVPQFIYDWILVPADWRISTRVLPQEVSDHRMLLARVTLPQ
jgi:endonuclease/exonuclease/phosphatase family metal-dependent hydrolase